MTLYDIVNFNRENLNRLNNAGFRMHDLCYIDLVGEYRSMVKLGEKKSFIVAHLAEKYRFSERTVWTVIKLFHKNVQS